MWCTFWIWITYLPSSLSSSFFSTTQRLECKSAAGEDCKQTVTEYFAEVSVLRRLVVVLVFEGESDLVSVWNPGTLVVWKFVKIIMQIEVVVEDNSAIIGMIEVHPYSSWLSFCWASNETYWTTPWSPKFINITPIAVVVVPVSWCEGGNLLIGVSSLELTTCLFLSAVRSSIFFFPVRDLFFDLL